MCVGVHSAGGMGTQRATHLVRVQVQDAVKDLVAWVLPFRLGAELHLQPREQRPEARLPSRPPPLLLLQRVRLAIHNAATATARDARERRTDAAHAAQLMRVASVVRGGCFWRSDQGSCDSDRYSLNTMRTAP